MIPISETPITATVGDFCRLTGIGRSRVYELLAAGLLDSIKIGNRRLIIVESYRRLVERTRCDERHQPRLAADCVEPGARVSGVTENASCRAPHVKKNADRIGPKPQKAPPPNPPSGCEAAPFDSGYQNTRTKNGEFSARTEACQ